MTRANVLGVGVHAVNLSLAAQILETAVESGSGGYVCVTGVHGVMEAQRNSQFKKILDDALLVVPDGVPTVWVGRWEGFKNMGRVFGPDLMLESAANLYYPGILFFFTGACREEPKSFEKISSAGFRAFISPAPTRRHFARLTCKKRLTYKTGCPRLHQTSSGLA